MADIEEHNHPRLSCKLTGYQRGHEHFQPEYVPLKQETPSEVSISAAEGYNEL